MTSTVLADILPKVFFQDYSIAIVRVIVDQMQKEGRLLSFLEAFFLLTEAYSETANFFGRVFAIWGRNPDGLFFTLRANNWAFNCLRSFLAFKTTETMATNLFAVFFHELLGDPLLTSPHTSDITQMDPDVAQQHLATVVRLVDLFFTELIAHARNIPHPIRLVFHTLRRTLAPTGVAWMNAFVLTAFHDTVVAPVFSEKYLAIAFPPLTQPQRAVFESTAFVIKMCMVNTSVGGFFAPLAPFVSATFRRLAFRFLPTLCNTATAPVATAPPPDEIDVATAVVCGVAHKLFPKVSAFFPKPVGEEFLAALGSSAAKLALSDRRVADAIRQRQHKARKPAPSRGLIVDVLFVLRPGASPAGGAAAAALGRQERCRGGPEQEGEHGRAAPCAVPGHGVVRGARDGAVAPCPCVPQPAPRRLRVRPAGDARALHARRAALDRRAPPCPRAPRRPPPGRPARGVPGAL